MDLGANLRDSQVRLPPPSLGCGILVLLSPVLGKFQGDELCLLQAHVGQSMREATLYPRDVSRFELSGEPALAFNVTA